MITTNRTIFRTDVFTRGGTQIRFEIKPAQGADPRLVANLYNGVLTAQDRGLAVNHKQIESRLERDPESVHLGLLDGEPVSLINVVKRKLDSTEAIPRTHQELTDEETFASTDPDQGNMWFCPWVAVSAWGRQHKVRVDKKLKSLGQLHVLAVKTEAEQHGGVERLFAYSRPGGLKSFVEERLGTEIMFFPLTEQGLALMKLKSERGYLFADQNSLRSIRADGTISTVITIQDYWELRDARGRRRDFIFDFHSQNGAHLVPELVMPYGQIFDGTSLAFRTLLEYPM